MHRLLPIRRLGLVAACLLVAVGAEAQNQPTGPVAALPQVDKGIKYKLSLMVSGGLDLDLFGEVVLPGVSCDSSVLDTPAACNTQARIWQTTRPMHYPDVYVQTPRRWHASAGFGIFQKDELIVQISANTAAAEENLSIGEDLSGLGTRALRATFTEYKDRAIEGGWRHYLRATGRSKTYVNLLYGRRKVEAIAVDLTAGVEPLGRVRLYDAKSRHTAAVVFGVTFEHLPIGVFLEAGMRWTQRLAQQDADLEALGLQAINNTGSRFFMPANVGLMVRF